MTLNIGSKYILRFEINGSYLIYTAIILEDDGILIKFKDRDNKEFSYNKNKLVTAEEIKKGEKDETKI